VESCFFFFFPGLSFFFRLLLGWLQTELFIQGRIVSAQDLALIQEWLRVYPGENRTRLSRELCRLWNWRNAAGRLKDMACRTLLLKLEARGQIQLPPRRTASVNHLRHRSLVPLAHDTDPIAGPLHALRPLQIQPLAEGSADARLFQFLLQRYHYLGLGKGVGEKLKYLVRDRTGRPLACLLFGAAAWKIQARNAWIGWEAAQRQAQLFLLANHSRFLMLPWVRVPSLASHVLAQITARLSADWQRKYGHPLYWVESFVQRDRFPGTCYRAAGGWLAGVTTGRSRNDTACTLQVPVKEIYLKLLRAEGREKLRA
jgi:hypothetical protein